MNEHVAHIDPDKLLVRRIPQTGKAFAELPAYPNGSDEREAQRLLLMQLQDNDFSIRYELATGAPVLIFDDDEGMLAVFREAGYRVDEILDLA